MKIGWPRGDALARLSGALVLGVAALLPFLPPVVSGAERFEAIALLPPLVAIGLTIATNRLLPALGLAVLIGAVLRHGPLRAVPFGLRDYVFEVIVDPNHVYIILFTLALLAMVQCSTRSGGARGVVELVQRWIRSARSTRVGTAVLGMLVFFDDYANCMLVGPTMRPLSDRYRISREKLAYIVDSTAAPVSGLVVISTWVGYEVGLISDAIEDLGTGASGYGLLISALPFRFYCIFTLIFVLLNAWFGRDFGPMLRAERRAAHEGKVIADEARPLGEVDVRYAEPPPGARLLPSNAVIPIGAVVVLIVLGLVIDGNGIARLGESPRALFTFGFWQQTLAVSDDNVQVLFFATIIGMLLSFLLPVLRGVLSPLDAGAALARGARMGLYGVLVLLSAWALARLCKDLGTGALLTALLESSIDPAAIPLATFIVAALISFATGTSWGTMAILIPTALPAAHAVGGGVLLLLAAAAVLDGSIFGDHCSPISDTTVMSSIGSSSDHLAHVVTQIPYAVVCMLVALGSYAWVALDGSRLWVHSLGVAVLVLILFVFGRKVSQHHPNAER